MTFSYDSSCLVALLITAHERHADTARDFDDRRQHAEFVLIGHTLLETFAVVTSLPGTLRVPLAKAVLALRALAQLAARSVPAADLFDVLNGGIAASRSGGARRPRRANCPHSGPARRGRTVDLEPARPFSAGRGVRVRVPRQDAR